MLRICRFIQAALLSQVTVEPGDEITAGSLLVELNVAEERAGPADRPRGSSLLSRSEA